MAYPLFMEFWVYCVLVLDSSERIGSHAYKENQFTY